MSKQFWFVIEGDNGSGKDTVADRLIDDRWFLASRLPQVVDEKERASRLAGVDRVNAFLSYNKMCADLIAAHASRSFLVRYWPSTIAAAFADAIFEWDEIAGRVANILRDLPAPSLILFLECNLNGRRNRVQQRVPLPGAVDDLSEHRDRRYREAIKRIANYPGVGNWKTLDTTHLGIEQVYQAVQSLLSEMEVM